MISVRQATELDYPQAFDAARKFHAEAPAVYREIPLHEDRLKSTLDAMRAQGLLLVASDGERIHGYAGAIVSPIFFSWTPVACELFWWVEPEQRGRVGLALFNALVEASRNAGAQYLALLTLEGRNIQGLSNLYERRGFLPFERVFIGRL